MADSAKVDINHSPVPPLPKSSVRNCTNKKKPVRRVVFSDIPPKDEKPTKRRQRDCCPGCCICCAWTCMVVFAIILGLLLIAAVFVAIVQADMPQVTIQRVSFPGLNVVNSSQKSLLSTDVDLFIELLNKNEKVGLFYGPMTVDVSSEKISLGRTDLLGFSQNPKNRTELKVHTTVTQSEVNREDAAFLKSNFKNGQMVFNVFLGGTIGFGVGGLKMNGLPLTVVCKDIEQSKVDIGQDPKCSVKMFALRTTSK